ncbi:MAG TPA: glycosyltransferase family 4 protein [Chitinophagaceae bacterium]
MKVAYITNYDSEDVRNWSGTGYYIAENFKKQGVELIRINCFLKFSFFLKLKRKLTKLFSKKLLLIERESIYLKKMAERAKQQLSQTDYDIIFSPGSLSIAYLKSNKPIVFYADATFDCLMDLYLLGKQPAKHSIRQGNLAESSALQNASLVFYTSEWAVESAVKKYHADSGKVLQSTFGANMYCNKTQVEIMEMITRRQQKKEKSFLFIGVDWHRKGAAKAIETVAALNNNGMKATLSLVGCKIPKGVILPEFVRYYPFISKTDKEGLALLNRLFEEACFFILPTIADCTPIVFSEAASYGVPVFTTDVGGCKSVVIDNETGYCINEENFIEVASKKIQELCDCEMAYESMSLNAYNRYQKELNWNVITTRTLDAMKRLIYT